MDKYKNNLQIWDKCAQQYQDKFMDADLCNDTYDLFCELIEKENASLLEIACGPGNIIKYVLNKRPDLKVLGMDLSSKMIELAKSNNPAAAFELKDARDILEIDKKFDAILCGFGLPYLSKEDAVKLIEDAYILLNPGGILYISTMEDAYEKSGYQESGSGGKDQMYIHYHEAIYLLTALKDCGFEIKEILRKGYKDQKGIETTDLFLMAKK